MLACNNLSQSGEKNENNPSNGDIFFSKKKIEIIQRKEIKKG